MTALGLGLLMGCGLFCLWWSCWEVPPRSARRRTPWLQELVQQAGLPELAPQAVVAGCFACAALVLAVAQAFTRTLSVAVCLALIAGASPAMALRARGRRRQADLRHAWPDAVDHLASGVRAGLSLPEALSALAVRGPGDLRPAFAAFEVDYRATGRFDVALDDLKLRLADPVGDRVIESLRLARQVGGTDLGRLLRTLADFLRADARLRGELEARQSWTVNAARLAVAAPWIVLLLLATRPESLAAYSRPAGIAVLAVGAGVSVVSYVLMRRIARLPAERRVLR
ncbi:MAG: type II secretion system F family protein [Angustibacter sp.]